jgi:hypothetical protein
MTVYTQKRKKKYRMAEGKDLEIERYEKPLRAR